MTPEKNEEHVAGVYPKALGGRLQERQPINKPKRSPHCKNKRIIRFSNRVLEGGEEEEKNESLRSMRRALNNLRTAGNVESRRVFTPWPKEGVGGTGVAPTRLEWSRIRFNGGGGRWSVLARGASVTIWGMHTEEREASRLEVRYSSGGRACADAGVARRLRSSMFAAASKRGPGAEPSPVRVRYATHVKRALELDHATHALPPSYDSGAAQNVAGGRGRVYCFGGRNYQDRRAVLVVGALIVLEERLDDSEEREFCFAAAEVRHCPSVSRWLDDAGGPGSQITTRLGFRSTIFFGAVADGRGGESHALRWADDGTKAGGPES
ncbi:hypothetical protein C8J57DRAFT_1218923 [Mycena rebaudengoi]|nr:hypothetical protein C8J57DRAFT_1218923 [Mycena rebaudengoi]